MKYIRKPSGGRFGKGYIYECLGCGAELEATWKDGHKLLHPAFTTETIGVIMWKSVPSTCPDAGKVVPSPDVYET